MASLSSQVASYRKQMTNVSVGVGVGVGVGVVCGCKDTTLAQLFLRFVCSRLLLLLLLLFVVVWL